MSRSVQYFIFCCCLLGLTLASGLPAAATRSGYPRSNRGFKSQGLSTARGFGKRDPGLSMGQGVFLPPGAQGQGQPPINLEGLLPANFDTRASYPNSWLIEELQSNPEAARIIVEKVIDENGDGEVTADELFRRIYF